MIRKKWRFVAIADETVIKDRNDFLAADNQYLQSLRNIDLTKCPSDFQTAFIRHIRAEEKLVPVTREVVMNQGFLNTLYHAILGDYETLKQESSDTWRTVEAMAKRYGASLE